MEMLIVQIQLCTRRLLALSTLLALTMSAYAQLKPPGYEREVQALEERRRTSILDQDSLTVIDTIALFDPQTNKESVRIVSSTLSWRDYMMFRLGINKPDELLNGVPFTLMDPKTYEKITVRWNGNTTKLDTIR